MRLVAALAAALLAAPPAAMATEHRVSGGEDPPAVPAVAAGAHGYLAAWSTTPAHPVDNAGEVYTRALAADGSPAGPVRRLTHMGNRFGEGTSSARVAYDPRARRYLVLWDGTGPTERIRRCGPSFPGAPPPPCSQPELAAYGRLLDEHGRPLGRQLRFTGPEAGTVGVVALRGGGFLVAYEMASGDSGVRSETFTVDAHGHRARRQSLPTDGCVFCPMIQLAPWGDGALALLLDNTPNSPNSVVLARRLDPRGRAAGPSRVVFPDAGTNGATIGVSAGGALLGARERDDRDAQGLSHFSLETRSVIPDGPVRRGADTSDMSILPRPGGWFLVGIRNDSAVGNGVYAIPLSPAGDESGAAIAVGPPIPHRIHERAAVAASPRAGGLAVWIGWQLSGPGGIELYAAPVPGAG